MNCSPPDCSVGILQAGILERVARPSSRGSSRPRDRIRVSYVSCTGRQFFTTSTPSTHICTPDPIRPAILYKNILSDLISPAELSSVARSILLLLFTQSCPTLCDPMQHARLPCPSPSPGVCSKSCPLSQWCDPIISFSFCWTGHIAFLYMWKKAGFYTFRWLQM